MRINPSTKVHVALIIAAMAIPLGTREVSASLIIGAEADTYIRTDLNVRRNDNYGSEHFVGIGTSRGGGGLGFGGADAMRSLIRFDVSGLLSPVVKAIMELTVSSYPNGTNELYTIDAHRILGSWIEGNGAEGTPKVAGATGVDPASGVAWVGTDANNQTQPAFASAIEATATVNQTLKGPGSVVKWNITSLVNDWILGSVANNGVLLRDVTTSGSFRAVFLGARESALFAPTDFTDLVAGPRLIVKVPEPATVILMSLGLVWLLILARVVPGRAIPRRTDS